MTRSMRWAPLLALTIVLLNPRGTPAQTDAGTPVVNTHTTDEISPVLVSDGASGAFVGFQTMIPTSPLGPPYGVIHVARIGYDATPDPAWTHARADNVWLGPGMRTLIVPTTSDRVWVVGSGQNPYGNGTFMRYLAQDLASGLFVHAGHDQRFVAEEMQAVRQADGRLMVLYFPGFPFQEFKLLVDAVDAGGVLSQTQIPFPLSTTITPTVRAATESDGGSVIGVIQVLSSFASWDLHAMKLTADALPAWSPSTRAICTATGGQALAVSVSDGAGGVFVAWWDGRSSGNGGDIYATHMLADGSLAPGWPANGKAVAALPSEQTNPKLVADGAGGAWLVWADARGGPWNIYYTHFDANGASAPGFALSGRALSTAPGHMVDPVAVSDRAGGLFVAWRDGRSGDFDLYSQHILADGSVAPGLPSDGAPVCTNASDQSDLALVDVAPNAAIVAWRDNRTGSAVVYGARVPAGDLGLGVPGHPEARLAIAPVGPNPASGTTEWTVSAPDRGLVAVRLLDAAGRLVARRTVEPSAAGIRVRFARVEPGLYFVSATQSGETRSRRFVILD